MEFGMSKFSFLSTGKIADEPQRPSWDNPMSRFVPVMHIDTNQWGVLDLGRDQVTVWATQSEQMLALKRFFDDPTTAVSLSWERTLNTRRWIRLRTKGNP